MTFTGGELAYLAAQTLGRLATVQPDGTLQVSPVGFRYNPDGETIDIAGYHMSASHGQPGTSEWLVVPWE